MPTLTVKDFSCIRSASLQLYPFTVLIGPQASGKSVLAKLIVFFSSVFEEQYEDAEAGNSIKVFKKTLAKRFSEWFPPTAWGKQPFKIIYEAGPVQWSVSRKTTAKGVCDDIDIEFSEFISRQYSELVKTYRAFSRAAKRDDDISRSTLASSWRVRSESHKALRQALDLEYVGSQIFVPAGRSFFTNLGKAFAIMEHGSPIDEVTKDFGRLFTHLIDGESVLFYPDKPTAKLREFVRYQKGEIAKIFGGEMRLGKNDRHVMTSDGRKIPLSALSSGQQELLPLLLVLQYFTRIHQFQGNKSISLLYLEEPEAHLFPSSQGSLTQHLAAVSNFTAPSSHMFITTHSPYVLTKLNTLIKAAMVANDHPSASSKVAEVLPQQCWVSKDRIQAYAIENGNLRRIMDEDGLIDAEYLDAVSGDLTADFMSLLAIENEHD